MWCGRACALGFLATYTVFALGVGFGFWLGQVNLEDEHERCLAEVAGLRVRANYFFKEREALFASDGTRVF